jgi:protein TIF31
VNGESTHITATSEGFFVNRSTDKVFDPSRKSNVYHSLPKLLSSVSPQFGRTLTRYMGQLQQPYSVFRPVEKNSALTHVPRANWMVYMADNETDHVFDPLRGLGGIAGGETMLEASSLDSPRDWNEELQLFKYQALLDDSECGDGTTKFARLRQYNLAYAQFVEVAIQGASGILEGSIPAIALGVQDSGDDMLYMWNNIFFSFPEANLLKFKKEGHADPELASRVYSSKDLQGIKLLDSCGVKELCTMPTVVIDLKGCRIVAQCLIPGILGNPDGAKIVYGSQEDSDPSLEYGEKRHIKSDPDFHELVGKVSSNLYWKEHSVKSEIGDENHLLWCSSDTKGILGHDSRKYLFEVARSTPRDSHFLNIVKNDNFGPYPHDIPLVRYELLSAYQDHLTQEYVKEKCKEEYNEKVASGEPTENIQIDVSKYLSGAPKISFNCDAGSLWNTADQTDSVELESLFSYLYNTAIPQFVEDCTQLQSVPVTGSALSQLLHSRGLSIRHLGLITEALHAQFLKSDLTTAGRIRLKSLKRVCEQEMWVRSFKHLARKFMRKSTCITTTVSVLLSLFIAIPGQLEEVSTESDDILIDELTSSSLACMLKRRVQILFRYSMEQLSSEKMPLLREACLKLGVQLRARTYAPEFVVKDEDILQISPLVKTTLLKSSFCQQQFDLAQALLRNGKLQAGVAALEQTLFMHEQTYLQVHPETLQVQSCLADVYYCVYVEQQEKQILTRALELQRLVVSGLERSLGIDSHEVASAYFTLATMEYSGGRLRLSLKYLKHVLMIYSTLYGDYHPEWIQIQTLISQIHARLKRYDVSASVWSVIRDYYESEFGSEDTATASAYHNLSQFTFALGHHKEAIALEKHAHKVWNAQCGPEDSRTKESAKVLEEMTRQTVQGLKINKLIQQAKSRGELRNIDEADRTVKSKENLSIDEMLDYINGTSESKRNRRKKKTSN